MSKFHSVVSRRDFMKGLGLAGAGLGATAAAAPVIHDLDELIASEGANWKRPWWVKHLEHHHPSTEVDFSMMQRHDQRLTAQAQYVNAQYAGNEAWAQIGAEAAEHQKRILGGKGNTLRDKALSAGAFHFMSGWPAAPIYKTATFMGPTSGMGFITPESTGLPKWSGTPEEANRMLRAAAVFYGAGAIGASELEKKLVFTHIKHGKTATANDGTWKNNWPPPLTAAPRIEFVDESVGYETDEVKYLPNNAHLMEVGVMIPMAKEAWRTASPDHASAIAGAANISRYRMWTSSVQPGLQIFLRGLGYYGYSYPYPDMSGGLLPSQASNVLGGVAEMGRHSDAAISPEWGANMGFYSLITDLPMAPDRPVDAGIYRFCHTCTKCADQCPSNSIPTDHEPTWEIPNWDYKVPNMNQQPGKKLFWTDMHGCVKYRTIYGCNICRVVCTFNVNEGASAHAFVKSLVSTTSIFNGFLYRMSDVFGYGLKDPDEWWEKSLPILGTDSTVAAYDGGYKK